MIIKEVVSNKINEELHQMYDFQSKRNIDGLKEAMIAHMNDCTKEINWKMFYKYILK